MKNYFALAFGLLSTVSFAQITNTPWSTSTAIGIGSAYPHTLFEVSKPTATTVNGRSIFTFFGTKVATGLVGSSLYDGMYVVQKAYTVGANTEKSTVLQNSSFTSFSGWDITNFPVSGFIALDPKTTTNATRGAVAFGHNDIELMRIGRDGKVRIANGTNDLATPGTYKLYVEDGILTEKVKVAVKTTANWADYVFANDYDLMPLEEVEAFTKENKHLPNIPSANEMVKEGLDVATMDAKLLEKIEELTLYLIEQNKKIEKQSQQIEALTTELKELKK